jgi:hypothetical protein
MLRFAPGLLVAVTLAACSSPSHTPGAGLNATCGLDQHAPAGAAPSFSMGATCAAGLTCVRKSGGCITDEGYGGICQAVGCDHTSPVCGCDGLTYSDLCALSAAVGAIFYEGACLTTPAAGDLSNWIFKGGTWGGDGIRMTLTATGGTVETDCGAGTIDVAPLVSASAAPLGPSHSFSWKGKFTRTGSSSAKDVTYRGGLGGQDLPLEIDGADGSILGSGTLHLGELGTIRPCMSTPAGDAATDAPPEVASSDGGEGG